MRGRCPVLNADVPTPASSLPPARAVDAARGSILVVDDDQDTRNLLKAYLVAAGFQVLAAGAPDEAWTVLDAADDVVDAVLLDVGIPQGGGVEFLKVLRRKRPHVSIVMVTASPKVDDAVAAMKAGAMDYLLKPVERMALLEVSLRAVQAAQNARELAVRRVLEPVTLGDGEAVFTSVSMQRILALIEQVKDTSVPILILGESGTGKEVVARYIHRCCKRSAEPFVPVNCAALPRELVESELFGHEKGSFTGAGTRHRGRFEEAGNGTIFLDEVGELDMDVQSKLLRVLQEREVTRVGGGSVKVNARVLVATNRDLLGDVNAGKFRLDLYYRLEVITLALPSLRERYEEMGPLAAHLLARFSRVEGLPHKTLSPEAVVLLQHHPWPGNIRELENVLKRSALMSPAMELQPTDLMFPVVQRAAHVEPTAEHAHAAAPEGDPPVHNMERESDLMMRALAMAHGNVAEAARWLGIGRATFYRRAKRFNMSL